MAANRGFAVVAAGIKAPLQHIAIDDDRSRNQSVSVPLLEGTDVNEHSSGSRCVMGLNGRQTAEFPPSVRQERVDARGGHDAQFRKARSRPATSVIAVRSGQVSGASSR